MVSYQVITDDEIKELFEGTNFGNQINNNVNLQRLQLLKSVTNKNDGYWVGSTVFDIMVSAGLVKDGMKYNKTELTDRGIKFLQ